MNNNCSENRWGNLKEKEKIEKKKKNIRQAKKYSLMSSGRVSPVLLYKALLRQKLSCLTWELCCTVRFCDVQLLWLAGWMGTFMSLISFPCAQS